MTKNEELHKIMRANCLGRRDVARMIGLTIHPDGQCYALCNWLVPTSSTAYRVMPTMALELLKLKVRDLTPADRAKLEGPTSKVDVIAKNRLNRACEKRGFKYADGTIKKVTGRRKTA